MILAWPLVGLVAGWVAWVSRESAGGRGPAWCLGWAIAGFLMSFSLVTGFSIGLFILPFAAAALMWVSRRSPHLVESTGFLAGIAITVAVIVAVRT
jgi:hypothetical protein